MDRLESSVSRFRRSLWWLLWFRWTVRSLVVGFWIAGSVILSLRLLWHVPIAQAAWTLLPLLLLMAVAGWLAWRRIPPAWAVRAAIDRSSQAHGLVMADGEINLGAWKEKASSQTLHAPQLHWTYPRSVGGIVVAALFVLLTLAMPESWLTREKLFAKNLDVATDVEQLEEKIDMLEELGVFEKEDADKARAELKKVEKDAEGEDPAKTLEALAHQEDQLKRLAEETASEAAKQARETSALAAAAKTLNKASSKMSKESLQKSMENLAKLAKKAAADAREDGLDASLNKESLEDLEKICKDGLSADELEALSDALGDCSKEIQDLLDQLGEMEMLDLEGMSKGCRELSPEELQLLVEALLECEQREGMEGENLEALLQACQGCLGDEPCDCFLGYFPCSIQGLVEGVPGRGGITRGPGAAKLRFAGETDEHGATFKNQILKPGGLRASGKMFVKKTSLVEPGGSEKTERSTGGGLEAKVGSGGAHTRAVLPTHRRVVREYFNRENK